MSGFLLCRVGDADSFRHFGKTMIKRHFGKTMRKEVLMNKEIYFDIQMFGDGAEGGGEAGTENSSGLTGDFNADFQKYFGNSAGVGSAPVSQSLEKSAETEDSESGADTGSEEEAAGENPEKTEEDSETDPEKEFEDLIKGKFKGAFQKRTQGIINERFKNAKETEGKLSAALDAVAPLFDRYGIEEGDFEGLRNAVQGDMGIFSKKALEKGMESEEYRDAFNADRDRKQQTAQAKKEAASKLCRDWRAQETEIQKNYPAFDLENAFKNEKFRRMAMNGESLLDAYRASHFDEIAAGLVAAATKRAAQKTIDSMQGNVSRPKEGGMSSSGGAVIKKDVSSLTGKDIESILKAVGRGEKITF